MRNIKPIQSTASKIRLLCKRHKLVVAVESSHDHTAYGSLFGDGVHFVLCNGKPIVVGAIAILDAEGGINCIGITDTDYDNITKATISTIQTDYTDLEAYAIWLATECVKAQLAQILDPQKTQEKQVSPDDIYDLSVMRATDLGSVRCHNDIQKPDDWEEDSDDVTAIKISNTRKKPTNNFKKISNIATPIQSEGFSGIVGRIKQLNGNFNFDDSYDVDVYDNVRKKYTKKDLIKGGDLVEAYVEIAIDMKVIAGSCNVKALMSAIRGCVTKDSLIGTNMFQSIKDELTRLNLQELLKVA